MCVSAAVAFCLLLLSVCGAVAQRVEVVVPNSLTNVEGNSSVNDFLNASSFRMQMVFDASQFPLPIDPRLTNVITGIGFRLDGGSTNDVVYFFGGATVTLSTTTRTPDNLSPIFAENVGSDEVTILDQAVGFGNTYQPGETPQPFNTMIGAPNLFTYWPSKGNLLVDIVAGGGFIQIPGSFDAQSAIGDSVSRVFAPSEIALSGTPDSIGLVTRFQIAIVPEPSIWVLILTGLGVGCLFGRGLGRDHAFCSLNRKTRF